MVYFGKSLESLNKAVNKELNFFSERISKLNKINLDINILQDKKVDKVSIKKEEILLLEGETHLLEILKEENTLFIDKLKNFLNIK